MFFSKKKKKNHSYNMGKDRSNMPYTFSQYRNAVNDEKNKIELAHKIMYIESILVTNGSGMSMLVQAEKENSRLACLWSLSRGFIKDSI